MPNGGSDGPVVDRTMRGSLANMNLTELDEARGIAAYERPARLRQSSALVGDVAARDYIRSQYRERARPIVLRRANDVPVFDHLYEVGRGEFVVAEGKANRSPFGKTNRQRRVFEAGTGGARIIEHTDPKAVLQFSPEWFEQRLQELRRDFGPEGKQLANRLEHSWREGKLRAIAIRAPDAGRTAEHVVISDVTSQWNSHVGAPSRHTMPIDRKPGVITDPARLLTARPTNVERGLEAAERAAPEAHLPHAGPHVPTPRPSTVEHLGEGTLKLAERGFKARSLVIGVKAWRAARTVGKVLIVCFVPLTLLDVVLEVALALWDREREKGERKRREKQRALEAVFKEGRTWLDEVMPRKEDRSLPKLIERNILSNVQVQDQFMRSWDRNRSFNGFQYARLSAILTIETYRDIRGEDNESLTTYRVESREVHATEWAHDFELTDIGEDAEVEKSDTDAEALFKKGVTYPAALRKIVKRKRLKYTIVPPLLTPYDVVITKMNNLFVDIVQFTANFTHAGGEIFTRPFQFDYRHSWREQFDVLPDFSHPLNASTCEYCLAYLFYSAKLLSRHPLEQQDLDGNMEDPRKGWQRRFWLLMSLLEGTNTAHGRNFSFFAEQIRGLVRRGEQSDDIVAALNELCAGARAIWSDLQRIEKNMHKPEYYYFGPQYVPSDRSRGQGGKG